MARRKRLQKVTPRQKCLRFVGVMALISLMASLISLAVLERTRGENGKHGTKITTRIAFGSGTSADYRSQPVWINGVIPSNPDAWIWVGDMAYLDKPRINCHDLPWHQQCNCSSTWLHQANQSCMAGDLAFASSRMEVQLSNPDYAQFLAFMCPGHRGKGIYPPTGSDPSICPRQIFGTYDDHDYGWENGNRRLPNKDQLKQLFLDAIGEPSESPRRAAGHGIEWMHTLHAGNPSRFIDIFVLDERYYRDTLPCHTRKAFCEMVALADVHHPRHAWCLDFLGGVMHNGSCCKKDEKLFYGWCLQPASKAHALWDSLCNPKSQSYGEVASSMDEKISADDGADGPGSSPFCEILGEEQRIWFKDAIMNSHAPLKLVVSSSVVIGNPIKKTCKDLDGSLSGVECPCFGDDWECYKPAQLQFLNMLTRTSGCVVVLAGGLEYSDIRVLRDPTPKHFGDLGAPYPLYQVMASGLSESRERNFSCDVLRQDPLHLRDHAECSLVRAPSFGMIEVEWGLDPLFRLQIRDGMTGSVKLESRLRLSTCMDTEVARKVKGR